MPIHNFFFVVNIIRKSHRARFDITDFKCRFSQCDWYCPATTGANCQLILHIDQQGVHRRGVDVGGGLSLRAQSAPPLQLCQHSVMEHANCSG